MFRAELGDGETVRRNASSKGKCVNALDSVSPLPCIYNSGVAHIDRVLMKHIINQS